MNLQTKMSEMGTICQLREDSKETRVPRLMSFKGLGKVMNEHFWVSRILSLKFIEMPEARSSRATFRDLLL
jgi:hypothetical protein